MEELVGQQRTVYVNRLSEHREVRIRLYCIDTSLGELRACRWLTAFDVIVDGRVISSLCNAAHLVSCEADERIIQERLCRWRQHAA